MAAIRKGSSGLTLIPKFKLEHIKLTSYSTMRVDLAAQVYHAITRAQNNLSR